MRELLIGFLDFEDGCLLLPLDEVPEFPEEGSYGLVGVGVVFLVVLVVFLGFVEEFSESLLVSMEFLYFFGPDCEVLLVALGDRECTLGMPSMSWFLWPSWRMHSMQMRRFSFSQKAALCENYPNTFWSASCTGQHSFAVR